MGVNAVVASLVVSLASGTSSAQLGSPAALIQEALARDEVARCLVEHHEPSVENAFREFLIAALEERRVEARTTAMALGMRVARSGLTQCGVGLQAMQSAEVQASFQLYSAWVGEKIMTEALSELGFR